MTPPSEHNAYAHVHSSAHQGDNATTEVDPTIQASLAAARLQTPSIAPTFRALLRLQRANVADSIDWLINEWASNVSAMMHRPNVVKPELVLNPSYIRLDAQTVVKKIPQAIGANRLKPSL
ncbi:MAG: hypothetical protein VKJ06_00365 [Vampirovibrionales bacterium]|nr:hypothetical protein [Vampirovibrionales bacterium]